ncbi:MAG: pentapeptide repeat-containing protein, partial [Planctomycetota bacterium]
MADGQDPRPDSLALGRPISEDDFVELVQSGKLLSMYRLEKKNFRDADLRGANCEGVTFVGSDLRGAKFDRSRLEGCFFDDCELDGASFDGADLSSAIIVNCRGSDLTCVGAIFDRATVYAEDRVPDGRDDFLDLEGDIDAQLADALTPGECRLEGDFSSSRWNSSELDLVDFGASKFEGSSWSAAKLKACRFASSSFENAQLSSVQFEGGSLAAGEFGACSLSGVTFDGTDLSEA